MKNRLTNAQIMRMQEERLLRRQNGSVLHAVEPVAAQESDPNQDGRPPECFNKERPVLPGVDEPDEAACSREVAFLRSQVALYRDEPYPVKVMLTPLMVMALLYLRGPNRAPSSAWVSRYVAMQTRGGWKNTHQHFAFDTDGLLRDGLHRLLAFLQSGEQRHVWIWFGIAPEDFNVLDTGQRRSAAQNLGVEGDKHPNLTTSVIRLRYRNEHNGVMPDDLLVDELGKQLIVSELFKTAVVCGHKLFKETRTNKSSGTLAYWMIGDKSQRAARLGMFFEHMIKGTVGKGADEDTSPLRVCRNKLIRMSRDEKFRHHQYRSQTEMTAWIIMAWNLWSNGNIVPSKHWPEWNHTHKLPVMDADDSHGTGEGRRANKREKDLARYHSKPRQRTPGNVARALGMM